MSSAEGRLNDVSDNCYCLLSVLGLDKTHKPLW